MPATLYGDLAASIRGKDQAVRAALRGVMLETAEGIQTRLEVVVADWTNEPDFAITTSSAADHPTVRVFPSGPYAAIWGYVDQGTRPHRIAPRAGGTLAFQTGYVAKTAAIAQVNPAGGVATGPDVFARAVQHPGSAARLFMQTAAEEAKPDYYDALDEALSDAWTT